MSRRADVGVRGKGTALRIWQNKTAGTGVAVTTRTYDSRRGWLTAKKYEGRTTRVVVGYLYDDIGNRKQSLEGGDANGAESQAPCGANVLNQ